MFENWHQIRDGDLQALGLFKRHYSFYTYRDHRPRKKFVGPGEYMALITTDGDALFVWRKFIDKSGQQGVNCAIFRNESKHLLSSQLIREAVELAQNRWPNERLYTYVNPYKIKSTNPGFCFKQAGWTKCGVTKKRKLIILEYNPGESVKSVERKNG